VLYVTSQKQDEKGFVMDLAREHNSTVLMTALITKTCRSRLPTESLTRSEVRREEEERRCWEDLYALEQEFKAAGIRSSVVVHESDLDGLLSVVTSTHCNLVVLAAGVLADRNYVIPEELLANLPCPIIVTQSG